MPGRNAAAAAAALAIALAGCSGPRRAEERSADTSTAPSAAGATGSNEAERQMGSMERMMIETTVRTMQLNGVPIPAQFTTDRDGMRRIDPHCRFFPASIERETPEDAAVSGKCANGADEIIDPETQRPYEVAISRGRYGSVRIDTARGSR